MEVNHQRDKTDKIIEKPTDEPVDPEVSGNDACQEELNAEITTFPDTTGTIDEGIVQHLATHPAAPSNQIDTTFSDHTAGETRDTIEAVRATMQGILENTPYSAYIRSNVKVEIVEKDGALKAQLNGNLPTFYEKQIAQEHIRTKLPPGWNILNKIKVEK